MRGAASRKGWRALTLDDLWRRPVAGDRPYSVCDPALPEPARRYLAHAIAPGTTPATAVRLRMHGEIKLGRWRRFRAEQVIDRERGMIWQARISLSGLPVAGSDRSLDGRGAMRWRLLGLLPLVNDSGPDLDRSALGRLAAEYVWLPSALASTATAWSNAKNGEAHASFALPGATMELQLTLAASGALETVSLQRWGNPDGHGYRALPFGAHVQAEATYGGFTIPSRLRAGWYFDDARFETEGEFFRVQLDAAAFR